MLVYFHIMVFGQATGCTEINFTTCDELGDFFENFDTLTATGQIPFLLE